MTTFPVALTTRKDWTSDQEVRWCPGCGDYSILAAMQMLMPDLGIARENTVFVSGIGCSSRFPYYMNTYGVHTIHGRAPAIATGLAVTRPDLHVIVISGDGDALSIGGNHFMHALRRNVNITLLLFNNRIYGLTKGQYSPTSEEGKVTKSTPLGSVDHPFDPISVALGAEATFVARTHDMDRAHMQSTIRQAFEHRGASLVEIYQNCNVFNDGAFEGWTSKERRGDMLINLDHGQPVTFGSEGQFGVFRNADGSVSTGPITESNRRDVIVHDEHAPDPTSAFALARLSRSDQEPTPMGVFRNVDRAELGDQLNGQVVAAQEQRGGGSLASLFRSNGSWNVP
jgi:2-oxoglutarate/2-oxoacid ferredoxin oxidoreductase subunit beta